MCKDIEILTKCADDMSIFYNALRGLLLELKALNNKEVNKLLTKYEVIVS